MERVSNEVSTHTRTLPPPLVPLPLFPLTITIIITITRTFNHSERDLINLKKLWLKHSEDAVVVGFFDGKVSRGEVNVLVNRAICEMCEM